MDRLTPPYKPGDRLTVNRESRAERGRRRRQRKEQQTPRLTARSGFDTYLLMRGFPHRLLGIRRREILIQDLSYWWMFTKTTT